MGAQAELDIVRAELARLHKLKRETQWRSTAYRCMVEIDQLKRRRRELRRQLKGTTS